MENHPSQLQSQVTLYALSTCAHCKDMKAFLQQHGIPVSTVYLDLLVGPERNATLQFNFEQTSPVLPFQY